MQKSRRGLNRCLLTHAFLNCFFLGYLCLVVELIYGLAACAPANAQEANEASDAPARTSPSASNLGDKSEKRFRWMTTGKIYLRYGGIQPPHPTNLFGFLLEDEDISNKREEITRQLFEKYNAPLEPRDVRLDLYELLLGFEAGSPKEKKWQGKLRVAFDVFELGTLLSGNDLGGRLVYANDFDSASVHEGFVSLSRAKVGELRVGITEGVMRRLDAGAREISTGGENFFGDVSQTPWHVKQLGWEQGNAANDRFPKIQYFAPKFYGVSIATEWFSNLGSPDRNLSTFSSDSSSYCLPSLFYTKDKELFEPNSSTGLFQLYDKTKIPRQTFDLYGGYYLQKDILPPPILEARCWQLSPFGSSWHEEANPSIMGGNVVVAYEKDFSQKKLLLNLSAHYGIRSAKAKAKESSSELTDIFLARTTSDAVMQINREASVLEQAAGVSMGLGWKDYNFFGDVTYLVPADIALKNVGGETLSSKGIEGVVWSLGIKAARLIPHKKGSDAKRKKKGALSLSFSQAIIRDPRYNGGEKETTLLLNLQSLYPITENIAIIIGYWYGEVAVSVPFFVTGEGISRQGVLFYERRLIPSHEAVIGLTMRF